MVNACRLELPVVGSLCKVILSPINNHAHLGRQGGKAGVIPSRGWILWISKVKKNQWSDGGSEKWCIRLFRVKDSLDVHKGLALFSES